MSTRTVPVAIGLVLLVGGGSVIPGATAQLPNDFHSYVDFRLSTDTQFGLVVLAGAVIGPGNRPINSLARFPVSVTDMSVDAREGGTVVLQTTIKFELDWVGDAPAGWALTKDILDHYHTLRGEVLTGFVVISASPTATQKEVQAKLRVTQTSEDQRNLTQVREAIFTAKVFPSPSVQVLIRYGLGLAPNRAPPDTWVTIPLELSNGDLYLQQVNLVVLIERGEGVDPTVLPIKGTGPLVLEPQEVRLVNVSFLTPKALTWYRGLPLTYTVRASNADNEQIAMSSTGILLIQGFYFSRVILIIIPLLILLTILALWALIASRRYYNERVLGKPIPPWRIRDEAERLKELRRESPRDFYVTRYFLMEEEYQSALNWFATYKKRSKTQLQNEAKASRLQERAAGLENPSLTRFDRRAIRIKKRTQRNQERLRLKLEAKLEGLQGKLDQHFEEDFERDHEAWQKKVETLKKQASRPWYKEHKRWEKDVEKLLEAWEKPFAKDKARHEKVLAKVREKYAKVVKKKDKPAWKDWKVAVELAEADNKVREREGKESEPLPELVSSVVGPPDLPKPFKAPPKPKLPAEPRPPEVEGLPKEPQLEKPKLADSHYAKKAARLKKKTERKIARLERKMNRLLARNERDRVRALAKADRTRHKLLRKSEFVGEPGLMARVFQRTPEDRERRNHKQLLKALAKERLQTLEETERSRLEVLEVEAKRREAELLAKLIRDRAEVRRSGAGSAMRANPAQDPALGRLQEENAARLEKERATSDARLAAEREKVDRELRAQMAQTLVEERTGERVAAPGPAPKKPSRTKASKK